jgi:hypothetical protein
MARMRRIGRFRNEVGESWQAQMPGHGLAPTYYVNNMTVNESERRSVEADINEAVQRDLSAQDFRSELLNASPIAWLRNSVKEITALARS